MKQRISKKTALREETDLMKAQEWPWAGCKQLNAYLLIGLNFMKPSACLYREWFDIEGRSFSLIQQSLLLFT